MNVKVITRHAPSNYGSLLQSIATIRTVESLGHECEIIDYLRPDERGYGGILSELALKPEWNKNPLKKAAYIAMRFPVLFLAQRKFDKFRKKYLKLTPEVKNHAQLSRLAADVFMTGSDQVWGPIGREPFDTAYMLDFVEKGRKVAYAASFGHTSFNGETQAAFHRLLPLYNHIGVRESHAVEIVKALGVETPKQVLDPTLLLSSDQWLEYVRPEDKAPEGKYILIYQIHNDPNLGKYADELSRRTGMPVYRVSPYLHQRLRPGKFIWLPSPGKFIAMIQHAQIMVTDSFHGTAFAINLNTPFVEILPGNGTSSRNRSLLDLTGLSDRVLTDYADFDMPLRKINFKPVNQIIAREREASLKYLKEILAE